MSYSKLQKEILKAIVKDGQDTCTLCDAINTHRIFDKRRFAIARDDAGNFYAFYSRSDYKKEDAHIIQGYIAELVSLGRRLYDKHLVYDIPSGYYGIPVIGRRDATRYKPDVLMLNGGKEFIKFTQKDAHWINAEGKQLYWSFNCTELIRPIAVILFRSFKISSDLEMLVKNKFRSEEEVRFHKQQIMTWVAILVSLIIGLLGIYVK